MSYVTALALCFILWSVYAIPQVAAEKVHGIEVNMLFETIAFVVITTILWEKIAAALPRVTLVSGFQGSIMGLGSAIGFYFFIKALSLAPGASGLVLVVMVAGLTFPAQGMLFAIMGKPLDPHQWFAIAGMAACIVWYNWKF